MRVMHAQKVQNVKVSDTRGDAIYTKAKYKKIFLTLTATFIRSLQQYF
jgi:hypothetical protein